MGISQFFYILEVKTSRKISSNLQVQMAFIFGVKIETEVHLYMPWQGLKIPILS